MRHTFLNVDTALIKTCHSLMVTEQEHLPPSQVHCSEMLLPDSFSIAEKISWCSQKMEMSCTTGLTPFLPLSLGGVPLGKMNQSPTHLKTPPSLLIRVHSAFWTLWKTQMGRWGAGSCQHLDWQVWSSSFVWFSTLSTQLAYFLQIICAAPMRI